MEKEENDSLFINAMNKYGFNLLDIPKLAPIEISAILDAYKNRRDD